MKSKLTLIALFALFFTPILVAIFLNSAWVGWRAAPDKAHGELVSPVIPLGEFRLRDANGSVVSLDNLLGRWQLVFVAPPTCSSDCLETVGLMRNIRLAQDRRASQVDLLLLSAADLEEATVDRITVSSSAWRIFDGSDGVDLINRFPDPAAGTFYIVDPEANIIERFPADADLSGVREDLDRLLTWTVREPQ